MLLGISLLSLMMLPLAALGASHHGAAHSSRHQQLAKRQSGDLELHKRFSSARWTFYDVGLGACGKTNVASDFIVALNSAQFGGGFPGPNCFKTITMTYNGKTTQAQIMDECPGCPYGGLDLSRGLFSFFASQSVGVLYGEWNFDGESPPPPPPKTTPKPKPTTSKYTPPPPPPTTHEKPTTTWTPEPTVSSSPKEIPTSTTHDSSSSTKASSTVTPSSTSSASTSTSAAAPSATLVAQTSNLQDMSDLLLNYGGLAVAGAAVST